jgi:hypothetical protein
VEVSTPGRESELADWAAEWLRERLPPAWEIQLSDREEATERGDAVIDLRGANAYATIVVEAKRAVAPRDVERMLGAVGRRLRALGPQLPILVVAQWLSPRTRRLLTAEGLNYLDQTGNASIRLENPAVFIQTDGATRDPAPGQRPRARLRGPKAGRLIRTLVDVRPPYGVRELADAAALAPGYVSRLLDALDEEALVERGRRGRVENADVPGLLRRWAESYDVFKTNETATFIAPRGASDALAGLQNAGGEAAAAVTGSFAAVRLAPVAAPALLVAYCDDVDAIASRLDLLPADQGSNVALLRPFDPVVWMRTEVADGIRYVAPSQAAVDGLTGTGRMPAEAEALLTWMDENEQRWRRESLSADRDEQP